MKTNNLCYLPLLVFSLFTGGLFAQSQISGTVTDTAGDVLPGVSVVLKGTVTGVTTNFDGQYTISVPDAESILVFSYLGMSSKEIAVGNRSNIDVVLEASSQELDEVVVTALGISREKKSLGYSVSEVGGDAIDNVPQENALNALSGKVSGVAINSTGTPGSSVSMVIRGSTSLSGDNQPLFVVDGVPIFNTLNNVGGVGRDNRVDYGNAISDINTDDIESMTVLKGASAAALYGSRAGNGVVLITTKSGKSRQGLDGVGPSITGRSVVGISFRVVQTGAHRNVLVQVYF